MRPALPERYGWLLPAVLAAAAIALVILPLTLQERPTTCTTDFARDWVPSDAASARGAFCR